MGNAFDSGHSSCDVDFECVWPFGEEMRAFCAKVAGRSWEMSSLLVRLGAAEDWGCAEVEENGLKDPLAEDVVEVLEIEFEDAPMLPPPKSWLPMS